MYSDNFGLALQSRIEIIKQEQLQGETGPTYAGAPSNMGFALFGRGIYYMDIAGGNLQFSLSGDVGGGFVRIPVRPVRGKMIQNVNDLTGPLILDDSSTIYKTDTRAIGPVVLGGTIGLIYHFSRHFALALDGRFLTGFPSVGAVLEGGFSVQVAVGGAKAVVSTGDEEEGGGPVNDAPPPADSASQEEEE
jgi:hypothetical protein